VEDERDQIHRQKGNEEMMKILIEVHSVLRHSEEEIEFFVGLREKGGGLLRNPMMSTGTPFCNFQRIPILFFVCFSSTNFTCNLGLHVKIYEVSFS
jgi:hypothetical protein